VADSIEEFPEPEVKLYSQFDNIYQHKIVYICIVPGNKLKSGVYRVLEYIKIDPSVEGQSVTYDIGPEFIKLGFSQEANKDDVRDRMVPWEEVVRKWPEYLV